MSGRLALTLASLLAFVAVALGAFGAHALKTRLAPDMQAVWQTAVLYHGWHALALFGVGLLVLHFPDRIGLAWAGWLFVAGIVLFSGSLYALALTGVKSFGAVTPLGGIAFLVGWLAVAWTVATG
ncbi:MAG TPA: DUF423 domain-containing protein [Casimicrobiaceae bacterium]|jgi:uncharacterized membrane protein YgdD (TMEM256/DUF423 family)